ncbi:MAG: hypothetical protein WDZ46_03380 [Solirubrobacterales bacterium]
MANSSTRERINALRESLKNLRQEEMPPWDLGLIYTEVLDTVKEENPDYRLAEEAERPTQNADRRATVQVAAMTAVLDQLALLYPKPVARPRTSRPTGRNWMTEPM